MVDSGLFALCLLELLSNKDCVKGNCVLSWAMKPLLATWLIVTLLLSCWSHRRYHLGGGRSGEW